MAKQKDQEMIVIAELSSRGNIYSKFEENNEQPINVWDSIKDSDDVDKICDKAGISKDELERMVDGWQVIGAQNNNDTTGFCGIIVDRGDHQATMAFRGSDGFELTDKSMLDWIGSDIGLLHPNRNELYGLCTPQQRDVELFLQKYSKDLQDYDISVTGHSLGGNLAEYATLKARKYGLDDNISYCLSLDGPGFSNEFIQENQDEYNHMRDKMYKISWSNVGSTLHDFDRPDGHKKYAQIKPYERKVTRNPDGTVNEPDGAWDKFKEEMTEALYSPFGCHDTKYVDLDNDGNIKEGEQSEAAKKWEEMTQGIDDRSEGTKEVILDFFIYVSKGVVEIKQIADEIKDGDYRRLYERFHRGVRNISRAFFGKSYDDVEEWYRRNFDNGYKYASNHPEFYVDTQKLDAYAKELQDLINASSEVNRRIRNVYYATQAEEIKPFVLSDYVGDLTKSMQKCRRYLINTSEDFGDVERAIAKALEG